MNTNIGERSIPVCIILSIITCGIYGIYWMAVVTDDVNFILDQRDTSGGMSVLFTIITCGIYGIYWAYRMGTKIGRIKTMKQQQNGANAYVDSTTSILYLILEIVGLQIVTLCLIQSEINHIRDNY